MIQQLLAEAGAADCLATWFRSKAKAPRLPPIGQASEPRKPISAPNAPGTLSAAPARLRLNRWTVSGSWTPKRQALVLGKPHGRIAFRFHARDLHLVMGPVAPGNPVRFRVLVDGKPPGEAHGGDIDAQGNGTVTEQRMYQLIRQPKPSPSARSRSSSSIRRSRPSCSPLAESRSVRRPPGWQPQESVDLSQLRRHVDEPRKRARLHLAHHLSTVRLDGDLADSRARLRPACSAGRRPPAPSLRVRAG